MGEDLIGVLVGLGVAILGAAALFLRGKKSWLDETTPAPVYEREALREHEKIAKLDEVADKDTEALEAIEAVGPGDARTEELAALGDRRRRDR